MRSVLVTRPQPGANEFAEKLRREGFHPYVAPLMEYVEVNADLSDLGSFQALIFTSAQAVQIFASRSQERRMPVLAVGDATALAARVAGFTKVISAKGDSDDVIKLLKTEAPVLGLTKVLHLCGEDVAGNLSTAPDSGVEVIQRHIYKAKLIDTLPEDVIFALRRGTIDVVTVFSNRTAENFVKILLEKDLGKVSAKLEAVCISERVASTLKELPWRIIRVAQRPGIEAVMEALREKSPPVSHAREERRKGMERRQKTPSRDMRGYIQAETYMGPDRRRLYKRRQGDRIMREKIRFLNRSVLTFAFMFIAIVVVGVFLMAPEYARMSTTPKGSEMVMERVVPAGPPTPVGGIINTVIEQIQGLFGFVGDMIGIQLAPVHTIVTQTATSLQDPSSMDIMQLLGNVAALQQDEEGQAAVTESMGGLRESMAGAENMSEEELNRTVDLARKKDPTLGVLLKSVKKEDLKAAAMLLLLNEFRGNVNNRRPYAEDLVFLQKFAGNDPAMNKALRRLAPYAEKGVMNRQALQSEFKSLAGDIVTAKLQGKDVSVQEQALQRFEKLGKVDGVSAIKGEEEAAVVARAQLLLDKGDVSGAMRELKTLEGASAQAAEPWMQAAQGHMEADQSSDDLSQGMLETISSASGNISGEDIVRIIKQGFSGSGSSVPYVSPSLTSDGDGGQDVLAPR